MLLVASETGHVYTFATRKLQPMITSEAGKQLIQTCLNSPDPPQSGGAPHQHDQRMSATGYEETELTYAVTEEEHKVRQMIFSSSTTSSASSSPLPFAPSSSTHAPLHHQQISGTSSSSTSSSTGISTITTSSSSSISEAHQLPHSVTGTLAPSPSPHQGGLASPVVSIGLQSHHHSPQYHHPPLSPHISPPISLSHTLPPHLSPTLLPQQSVISSHNEHSTTGGLIGLHHHHPTSHLSPGPPQTPLPPHSPLPPVLSPMGAPSPTPSFQPTAIHHHPHHIATHTR